MVGGASAAKPSATLNYNGYVRRAAERDIAEAQIWYEEQQIGLAAQFHSEIDATMNLLAEEPLIYPVLYRAVRRAVLHRFPYLNNEAELPIIEN